MSGLRFTLTALLALAGPASAQDGAQLFKRCLACHSVTAPDGTVVLRGGRVGPNLFGVVGRPTGSVPGFNYSISMQEARAQGLTWNQANFTAYLRNPTEYLKGFLDDPSARARMAFRLNSGGPAVYRYLQDIAR